VGAGATLTGAGTVTVGTTAGTHLSGSGKIVASSGSLGIVGTVGSGLVFQISSSAASTLKIGGTATASTAITDTTGGANTFNNARSEERRVGEENRTRRAAQPFTKGKIQRDGGSAALTET